MVRESMRHFVLLVSLLATVAVIAGCGGSSGSSGGETSGTTQDSSSPTSDSTGTTTSTVEEEPDESGGTLSKSEFIAQADDVCKRTQEESAPLEARYNQQGESANTPPELKELGGMVRKLLGYAAKGISEVQELEEPAADTKAIEDYAAVINERISTGKDFAGALESGNQNQANSLVEKAGDIASEAESLAADYGFKVCGSNK